MAMRLTTIKQCGLLPSLLQPTSDMRNNHKILALFFFHSDQMEFHFRLGGRENSCGKQSTKELHKKN